jgi:inner membrane protein
MHREGHVGAALLVYAPLGFVAMVVAGFVLAVAGGGVAIGLAMVPDQDQRIPGIKHRGATHTVHFAAVVGVLVGAVGAFVGWSMGLLATVALGVFGFAVGAVTILAHLAADALTPMGVRPLEPVDDREYCLDVAKAANPVANYALLALGILAAGLAFVLGSAVTNAVGL